MNQSYEYRQPLCTRPAAKPNHEVNSLVPIWTLSSNFHLDYLCISGFGQHLLRIGLHSVRDLLVRFVTRPLASARLADRGHCLRSDRVVPVTSARVGSHHSSAHSDRACCIGSGRDALVVTIPLRFGSQSSFANGRIAIIGSCFTHSWHRSSLEWLVTSGRIVTFEVERIGSSRGASFNRIGSHGVGAIRSGVFPALRSSDCFSPFDGVFDQTNTSKQSQSIPYSHSNI